MEVFIFFKFWVLALFTLDFNIPVNELTRTEGISTSLKPSSCPNSSSNLASCSIRACGCCPRTALAQVR